jgi:chitodextrinase
MLSRRFLHFLAAIALGFGFVFFGSSAHDQGHLTAAANLVVAYSFDEGSGSSAADASGNNNNAVLLNGATWGTGHSGSAASFDGLNDFVSSGNIPALNGLTAVTVSAWIKGGVGANSPNAILVAKDAAFALVVGAHKAQFAVKTGNNWLGFPTSATTVDDGQFHFLTGVFDGQVVYIYVDGVLEASKNIGRRTLNTNAVALTIASCIGGPNCDSSGEMWRGVVDDVRVYNRALSLAEIQADRVTPVAPPETIPPSVPTGLAGTAVSASRIDLSWTASTDNVGVTGYTVFRNGSPIGTAANTSFSDTGLIASTTYSYAVAAFDAAGNNSAQTTPINVTTGDAGDVQPPSVPTGLAASGISPTQISLSWTASTDNVAVSGYRVLRNGQQIATTAATSYTDGALTPSTSYTYAVSAFDASGNASAASQPISVTTQADSTPPSTPTNVAGTATSSSQVSLSWTASTDNIGVTGYRVFRNGNQVGTTAATSYADSGLAASTTYSYAIVAADAAGNTSAPSVAIEVTTAVAGGTTALASDNFNRANGGLGPNWTVIDSDPRIVNQQVQETNASDGNDSIPIYTALSWPANQYSQVIIRAASLHSGCSAIVRAKNDPVIEMYFVYVTGPLGPNARLTLAKFVTHIYTELWTSVMPVNAGDLLYLEADGNKLTVKLNGVVQATRTDNSITAAGFAGLDITDYDGLGAPGDGQCDDWEAGVVNTGGGGDTTPPSVPTNLAGNASSSSQITLTWTASTDNVGVTGYKVFRNGSQIATTATPGYADSGLTLSTSYSYAVAAFDAAGNTSAQTAAINVTTLGDTTAPSVPTNLAGNAVSSTQITLTWTASTDNVAVTGYKVFRNGSQIATTATPGYADSGLTLSTSYSYAVAAFDAAGNTSAQTTAINVTTLGDTTPPSVPTNLAGNALSSSQITLTWTASTDNVGVTGYKVFRNGSQVATTATPGYADSGLSLGTGYSYAVAAFDAAGNTSAQTTAINVTTLGDTTAPSVPTNLAGNAVLSTQITLTWTASTDNVGVTGYKVFRNGSQVATTGTPGYTDSGLLVRTTYSYAVAAFDAADNASAQTTAISVTTLGDTEAPSVPTNLAGNAVSSTQVNLTWTASTDNLAVTGYRVFRDGSPITTTTGLSFGDSGLSPSTTYNYSVAAFDAAGNTSAATPSVAVTTQVASGETVLAQDSFNRANGGLGPNWTVIDSNPVIVNQHVQETNASDGNDSIPIYTAVTWPANQYSQVRVLAASPHSGCSAIVRAKNDPVIEMYFVYVVGPLGPNAKLVLAKFVQHIYTELWTSTRPVESGDVLYLSIQNSTLTVKLNGGVLTTATDTSITAPGYAGLDITDYDGHGNPGDGQCDDWEAGAITTSTPDVTPPSVPTNLNGTAGSSSHVQLTWTASTDDVAVTAYTVYRDGVAIGTTPSPLYDDTGLSASTLYSYSVAAADAAGNISASSPAIDVTTLAAPGGDTVLAQDNFNRANGGLGPNWTVIASDPRIANGRVQETNATDGNDAIPIYTAVAWPANQYSQVRVVAASQHSGCSAVVRAKNDPLVDMYFVYVIGPLGPNAQVVLAKFVRHNYTELWSSTRAVNSGDLLYLGAHGSTLTVKLNGEVLTTMTDTSITAPGFAGLDITDYDGQGAPGQGLCDDWEGGAIGEGSAMIAVPAAVVADSKPTPAIDVDVALVPKTGWYN